jgi:hypothetical protein
MPDILAMLVSERDKLDRAIKALGGEVAEAVVHLAKAAGSGRRTLSAEVRARIAAAQKARWAKTRAAARTPSGKRGPVKMSAEAKAKISNAKKAWWAAKKKGR